MINEEKIKLHLGCDEKYINDFIHIDYVFSAFRIDMFEDNSVNLISACHILKHFKESRQTLFDNTMKYQSKYL